LKDSSSGFGVILSVKYLGYCGAKCKKDGMKREMKGTGCIAMRRVLFTLGMKPEM